MGICQSTSGIASPPAVAVVDDDAIIENQLDKSLHNKNTTQRQKLTKIRTNTQLEDDYEILEILGQGSMGEVTIVRKKQSTLVKIQSKQELSGLAQSHESNNTNGGIKTNLSNDDSKNSYFNRAYACKTVNTVRMNHEEIVEFLNEIEILRDLDHPNIIQLFQVYQAKRKLWIVTEICRGGDLSSRMVGMTEEDVAVITEQILRAVSYMHNRGVCHRDIKLENIMFSTDQPDSEIKLIDFGLSNKFTKGTKMLKACGTVYTAAPEVLTGSSYSEQADIWSIGCVTYILTSMTYPFLVEMEDMQNDIKMNKLLNAQFSFQGPLWKKITKPCKEFISNSLRKHPGARWTSSEALEHVHDIWIPHLEVIHQQKKDEEEELLNKSLATHAETNINTNADAPPSNTDNNSTVAFASDVKTKSSVSQSNLEKRSEKKRSRMKSDILNGMQTFAMYGELKKTILMTMAYTMDKTSLNELRDIFIAIDTKGNGTIDFKALKEGLSNTSSGQHFDDDTISKLFDAIDIDRSGQIHYVEFLAAVSESQGLITMEHLAEAFDRIDEDGKGFITKDDLKNILGSDYNEDLVNRMINEADYKKNGQVDYDEFLRLMFEDPESGADHFTKNWSVDKTMTDKLAQQVVSPGNSFR